MEIAFLRAAPDRMRSRLFNFFADRDRMMNRRYAALAAAVLASLASVPPCASAQQSGKQ
jgi:hypothetical protein